VLGVADEQAVAVGRQPDDAQADGRGQRLPDGAGGGVEEDQAFHVHDGHRLTAVEQGPGDGPAGEGDLLAGRLEQLGRRRAAGLVGRHADGQRVAVFGRRLGGRGAGQEANQEQRTIAVHEAILTAGGEGGGRPASSVAGGRGPGDAPLSRAAGAGYTAL